MSFILDALKKSETDRQQQGSTEFAGVPTSGRRREGPPAWLWVVGALLLINLAVLIGIFTRPDPESVAEATPTEQVSADVGEPSGPNDFASRAEAARRNPPAVDEQPEAIELPVEAEPVARVEIDESEALALPTYQEVQARGTINVPPLHVDIHVYSDVANDRFVFVNMAKHTEGSRLAEGPLVEEIVPQGVVLEMNGTRFLLPRD